MERRSDRWSVLSILDKYVRLVITEGLSKNKQEFEDE